MVCRRRSRLIIASGTFLSLQGTVTSWSLAYRRSLFTDRYYRFTNSFFGRSSLKTGVVSLQKELPDSIGRRDRDKQRDERWHCTLDELHHKSVQDIDLWMSDLVASRDTSYLQQESREITDSPPFHDISEQQETELILYLERRGAFHSILQFIRHFSRPSAVVYTAAISALALSPNQYFRREALSLLAAMEEREVTPSPYIFSALFNACESPNDALSLKERLETAYPSVRWTRQVWEAAIYACSRSNAQDTACWPTAEAFYRDMLSKNVAPTRGIVVALFRVCSVTRNVSASLLLLKSLIEDGSFPVSPRLWGAAMQVCATAGDHEAALHMMRLLSEHEGNLTVQHCTFYLRALVTGGELSRAASFLRYMLGTPNLDSSHPDVGDFAGIRVVAPDTVALRAFLQGCASAGNFDTAYDIIQEAKRSSNIVTEECYMQLLSACSLPAQAKQIIKEMRLSRRHRVGATPPSAKAYTRAIAVCRRSQDVESALFLLNSAQDDGIEPDAFMYTAAIWAAAQAKASDVARELFEMMRSRGCDPTVVSCNGLIAAIAGSSHPESCIEIYEGIEKSGLSPDSQTFRKLAIAARNMPTSQERINFLFTIYKKMRTDELRVQTGGALLQALMKELGSAGRANDAVDIFRSILGPVDVETIRCILYACSTSTPPAWATALELLHSSDIVGDMAGPGLVDSESLGYAMIACAKANEWNEALTLFRIYGNRRTPLAALNSLVLACGRNGHPDIAMEIFNSIEGLGIKPDKRSYRNAIIVCNQAQHYHRKFHQSMPKELHIASALTFAWWECALSLLRRMKEQGLIPDKQSYSSAISACEAGGKWQIALAILQSMLDESEEEEDGVLNIASFNAAISACEKGGAWVEALEIYERMVGVLNPNKVTLSSLVLALDKAGQKELALAKYEEGLRSRVVNPWRQTKDSLGKPLTAMDLHHFSAAMARVAVRSHLEGLVSGAKKGADETLTIIVGKGLRSENEPVLKKSVLKVLRDEYGLHPDIDSNNEGRFLIDSEQLKDMCARKRWR